MKKIFLAVPNHFGLPQRFRENLEALNYEVFLIERQDGHIPVPFKDYLIHGFKKYFLGDRTHKPAVRNIIIEKKQIKFIDLIETTADLALFIRPDLFSQNVIKEVKKKSKKTVAYQWDGIQRFPIPKKTIELFDEFYVFDRADLVKNPKFKLITNFYFDDLKSPDLVKENSVFFVGSYIKERIDLLNTLAAHFEKIGLHPDFYINCSAKKQRMLGTTKFNIINKPLSFRENIELAQKAGYLLDIVNPVHNGLSFRTFESVGYKKKLITNNRMVKEYDFYHPDNIFIFDQSNLDSLADFISRPYHELPESITKKYGFTDWISKL